MICWKLNVFLSLEEKIENLLMTNYQSSLSHMILSFSWTSSLYLSHTNQPGQELSSYCGVSRLWAIVTMNNGSHKNTHMNRWLRDFDDDFRNCMHSIRFFFLDELSHTIAETRATSAFFFLSGEFGHLSSGRRWITLNLVWTPNNFFVNCNESHQGEKTR